MKNGYRVASLLVLLGLLLSLAVPLGSWAAPDKGTEPLLSPRPPAAGSPLPSPNGGGEGGQGGRDGVLAAAGRGNPWINLLDGEPVPTTYMGAPGLLQSLDTAQPRALTADDFDEDGMSDLVAGYAAADGGLIAIHRGSIDYLWPDGPEAEARKAAGLFVDTPFLPEVRLFPLPVAPDFLGAGDFDNDGHRDVVAAARGGEALYLLSGDGRGGLGAPEAIPVPGTVTAFAAGEVNRRDGLQDLVVGVVGGAGRSPLLVIFEGPTGALRWEPEVIPLPALVPSIAIGQLDEHYAMDIAAACGETLVLVHGRDRQLSVLPPGSKAAEAAVTFHALPYPIAALALGDFVPEEGYVKELALLAADGVVHFVAPATAAEVTQISLLEPATWNLQPSTSPLQLVTCNVSSFPADDLAMLDPAGRQVRIVVPVEQGTTRNELGVWDTVVRPWSIALDTAGAPAALLPMRLNPDALSDLVVLQAGSVAPVVAATAPMYSFTVDDPSDLVDECADEDGVCAATRWDGTTDECVVVGGCTLYAAIQEINHGAGASSIHFSVARIKPDYTHYMYVYQPVTIDGTSAGRVEFDGTNFSGYDRPGFDLRGGDSVVRGMVLNHFADAEGIVVWGAHNIVEGNYVGTDRSGSAAAGNAEGLTLRDPTDNTVGGTTAQARNVFSGNADSGIQFYSGVDNRVQGNYCGTDGGGNVALGNGTEGILLGSYGTITCTNNTVVGNVVSGNSPVYDYHGLVIGCHGSLVQGNLVGTNAAGTAQLGNGGTGIVLSGAANTLGGTAVGAGNIVAGSEGFGLGGYGGPDILIQGSIIGTNAAGSARWGNDSGGILLNATNASVGGTVPGAGNTIAFNGYALPYLMRGGVHVEGYYPLPATGNRIYGNRIYGNSGLGINLGAPHQQGFPNDPGDIDEGPNRMQNYPLITDITMSGGTATLVGTLNSMSNTAFVLDFYLSNACDPSGYGEGRTWLGAANVTTGPDGNAAFVVPVAPRGGKSVTATATDPQGNTSEFSLCADLPRYKLSEPDRVTYLHPVTYTVGIKNTAMEAQALSIADAIPTGTRFISGSLWASEGTPNYDGSQVTWNGALDPGVELQVRFQVSTTCDAPELITNQAQVTQQGETYSLEADTERYEPVHLDIAAKTPSPTAGARGVTIDPSPALSWTGEGVCGTDPNAGHQVAYRVYLQSQTGGWQEVGAYPNCGRSVALPAGALQCGRDGDPNPYTWKVEAVDLQNPCRDPVVVSWTFETASCRPAVEVKPQFEKYFLTGLGVDNTYRAEVDWNGPARQGNGEALADKVHFDLNGTEVVEDGQPWGAEHAYDMGGDFRASLFGGDNVLRIWAGNTEDYQAEETVLQPMVFPLPAWITQFAMGDFEIDLQAMTVKYAREVEYPDPHFEARYHVPDWVPYLGGADMGIIETFATVGAEACSDGSGAVEVSGNTGVQLTEDAQVTGKLYGRGDVRLGPPAGLDLVGATFGLEIAGRIAKEMGIADLIPGVRAAENWPIVGRLVKWFNSRAQVEGAIEPQMQIETQFKNQGDGLDFDSGTGMGKIKMMLTLSLEVFDWLKAAIYGGGEPRVVVQVPSAGQWGYLQEIAIRFFAGLRLTVWRFEGEWERGVTCSLPAAGCQSDEGEAGLLAPAWRLLGRDYAGADYARFVAGSELGAAGHSSPVTPPAALVTGHTTETPLVLNIYPLADPALAVRADGARVVLWVHDDVSRPIGQSEEIHAAHWDGASWVTAILTTDAWQDFNPLVTYDAQGDAVALWERSNTVWFSPTLTITYARSFEIATAVWDHGAGQWSEVLTLTSDSRMDVTPHLARGQDGALLALWRTGDGTDLVGTLTHPLSLTYALWDGTAWSTPTAALGGLANVLDVDLAVYSATRAALVLAQDGDGDLGTGSDGEIAYATWDGTAWSGLTLLTSDAITDSHPAVAYDPAGEPVVVWLRAGDVVQQVGWAGAPVVVRPASTSGAFLDLDLAGAPDGNLALVWQTLGASGADAAYSIYDPLHASWGADHALMADPALDESFAPALGADALLMAYQKVTIEFVTLTYDISPTLTITVPNVPQPVQADLYFLEHTIGNDLAVGVGDLVVSPPNPAPGASAVLTATIHNAGDLAIVGGEVAFYDGAPGAGGTLIGITQTLPGPFRAATTATVSVAWTVPAGDIPHPLYVVADPANTLAEGDETNNITSHLTVQPDLAVGWAHSNHSTAALTLTAVVANSGVTSAEGPFTVTFRAADPVTGTLLGAVEVTPTVPAGGAVTVTLALTDPAVLVGLGDLFWTVADAGGAIPEADEANNAGYGALGALPDLTLTALDIVGAGPVVVTVHNTGVVTASDIALMVWEGSFSGTVLYSGTVGTIPPGGSSAISFALPAGTYELWAQADPHYAIPESDEGNNLAIRQRRIWNRVYLPLLRK